jgi:hypothetical protein
VTARRFLTIGPAALALAIVLASCGGGGSTTVTERTEILREAKPAKGRMFLPDVLGKNSVKPAKYSFSVDGDLVGTSLDWHGWGEAKATAFGKLEERSANGLVDTFSGSVTASKPVRCKGATYYTRVMAHVPPQANFVPGGPTKLDTPCD